MNLLPINPVTAPQRHAPTTTHTSNTVTNFDVAVRILVGFIFHHIETNTFFYFEFGLVFMNYFKQNTYRIGVSEYASTNMKRTVKLTV